MSRRVTLSVSAATVAAAVLVPVSAGAQTPNSPSASPKLGVTVTHTGKGPTGYQATFRIKAPTATSMQIKGEWGFASFESVEADSSNAHPVAPSDWKPGDFPLESPNSPGGYWPVASMTEDTKTGVWSYTTPLPSGVFTYSYYANCTAAAPALKGCTGTSDPANPPWNTTTGSTEANSQVYVPSDPKSGTADASWEADAPAGQRGKLVDVAYPTPNTATGTHPLAVYTPAGYDPKRKTPYPVLVLTHGGGGNEMDWSTQGRMQQIVDNLTRTGKMQPTVIVMPDGGGLTSGASFTSEVADQILPYVEKNYHVGTSANDRSFAGLSAYGTQANNFLFTDTSEFGYYGVWSPAAGAPGVVGNGSGNPVLDADYTNPALKQVLGIHLGIGAEDLGGNLPALTAVTERVGMLNAGVPFTFYTTGGGHTWDFWRQALRDFLTKVDFRATTTTVSTTTAKNTAKATASVSAATDEPVAPTGTVQFKVDGTDLGKPVKLAGGKATVSATASQLSGHTITAVYSGATTYNPSTSAAVTG
ncbi:putative esterase [Actinacidiphila reveromycinica]|uniref:Putative esterase n=1 Tax=Actinacidiphila reveromycinica TaxID=659352 RepID=A0A7U3VM07_9ACTN|nr:Ig-like domain repeat protein [Streptomyces sp. SN-593]BBA96095.1 putative esterase [Streptomyces sp. SN-593]